MLVLAVLVWGVFALWFQGPAPLWARLGLIVVWCLLGVLAMFPGLVAPLGLARGAAWAGFGVAFAALLIGWAMLTPSHDRQWADDVARMLRAEVHGSQVTLHNLRNFDWRSPDDYTVRWESRDYDLARLESADLILSYWMGPAIAHTLVSFGFDDGRQVVFSVEIRKERHERFSAIAGFFRQYEIVMVAADESDIVRLRSNARGEDVYLYRLAVAPAQLRTLFLSYVEEAGQVYRQPRFYNTLTTNCTTIVFELARRIVPGLPLDYRLLLSGYLAKYAYDVGALVPGHSFADLRAAGRITDRARAADASGEPFGQAIRRGVPGIPAGR